jgi:hypothetical protein
VSELSPGKKVRINKNGVGSENCGSKKLGPRSMQLTGVFRIHYSEVCVFTNKKF